MGFTGGTVDGDLGARSTIGGGARLLVLVDDEGGIGGSA